MKRRWKNMTKKQRIENHESNIQKLLMELKHKKQELGELTRSRIQDKLKVVMMQELESEIRYLTGGISFNKQEIKSLQG